MENHELADDFWQFSLRLYGSPGIEAASLELQDRFGLNVNMVLYCCWAGSLGIELDSASLSRLVTGSERWQQAVVRPLREVRRGLKDMEIEGISKEARETVRNIVKSAELRAEKQEQFMLAGLLGEPRREQPGQLKASRNFERYLSITGAENAVEITDIWAVIVATAFGNS
ncbi:MAG: TIGR02444 family protein [Alphaproteobacteria bacterium]|jgi:uncharacterized protein (TIGR02444 family)|nr:TIGR02444 family protein [Alphaproteobacteria bacterium]|tara:strand:+ start:1176 stop:1688 length:513 start_codon:yes stop_codon:yes gene_type:complete